MGLESLINTPVVPPYYSTRISTLTQKAVGLQVSVAQTLSQTTRLFLSYIDFPSLGTSLKLRFFGLLKLRRYE